MVVVVVVVDRAAADPPAGAAAAAAAGDLRAFSAIWVVEAQARFRRRLMYLLEILLVTVVLVYEGKVF